MTSERYHFIVAIVSVLVSTSTGACVDVCADYYPNADIKEIAYRQDTAVAQVSLTHALSYCTGTDEPRFAMELLEIDLNTGTLTAEHRTGMEEDPFRLPADLVFQGSFGPSLDCRDCAFTFNFGESSELSMNFIETDEGPGLMLLEVLYFGDPVINIEIDGYQSRAVASAP